MIYTTDKPEHYLPTYQALAREIGPCDVLEIGAAGGEGMAMFRDLFGPGVVGVDADPGRAGLPQVVIARQEDPALPAIVPGPWGMIVDDASHDPALTYATLYHLWPTLASGGAYVIEDWNHVEGENMFRLLQPALFGRVLRYRYQGNRYVEPMYFGEISDVDSVTVRHGLIIIRKGAQ